MKTSTYLMVVLIFTIVSCKKPTGKEETVPGSIHFVILGKDGKNIIHSVKDSLNVIYILNGVTKTSHLTVYKVQVSASDTTAVSKYNAFVISDRDKAFGLQGYITDASAAGVRNFNLYLNGVSIGTIYLDYWGYLSLPYPPPLSSTFTFNGVPATFDHLVGVFNNGSGIAADVEYHTDLPGDPIAVLQLQ
ncbi:MAG: hypothetical protein ACHQIM_15970 [Sphingobacteriales bacterium]